MRKRTNQNLTGRSRTGGKVKLYAAALGLATAGTFVLSTGGASAHGYTDQPLNAAEDVRRERRHRGQLR